MWTPIPEQIMLDYLIAPVPKGRVQVTRLDGFVTHLLGGGTPPLRVTCRDDENIVATAWRGEAAERRCKKQRSWVDPESLVYPPWPEWAAGTGGPATVHEWLVLEDAGGVRPSAVVCGPKVYGGAADVEVAIRYQVLHSRDRATGIFFPPRTFCGACAPWAYRASAWEKLLVLGLERRLAPQIVSWYTEAEAASA